MLSPTPSPTKGIHLIQSPHQFCPEQMQCLLTGLPTSALALLWSTLHTTAKVTFKKSNQVTSLCCLKPSRDLRPHSNLHAPRAYRSLHGLVHPDSILFLAHLSPATLALFWLPEHSSSLLLGDLALLPRLSLPCNASLPPAPCTLPHRRPLHGRSVVIINSLAPLLETFPDLPTQNGAATLSHHPILLC